MVKIIPAILTSNVNELRELLLRVESAGIDRVQIDIIDGAFADNKTIDPSVVSEIDTSLNIDFHLMVKEPINWIEKCITGGADRIIGQIEEMSSQEEFLGKVQEVGVQVGLALNLDTSVSAINSFVLNSLDVVLVMSVMAGHGGQEFDSRVLEKIKKLNKIRAEDPTPFKIIDDGGVSLENIDKLESLQVDEVAIGRRIFDGDLKENIEKYKLAK
jgi:ribulose-phosphate 3-epimerase